ncbi:MAG TPA: CFI-box-CTERM domain-containing protein, partial [Rhodocyclaceae bacterium]|nr:CFI-box-CTERM domain-containing protein [Rhodocyclaceae bacterium]
DPHVNTLREFRDRKLLPHASGRWLVETYYRHSPPLADFIRQHDSLRWLTRLALTPAVVLVAQPALSLGFLLAVALLLALLLRGGWRAGRGTRPA